MHVWQGGLQQKACTLYEQWEPNRISGSYLKSLIQFIVVGLKIRHELLLINYIYRVIYCNIIKYSSISNMNIIYCIIFSWSGRKHLETN
jgi:hypothetical protein